MGKEATKLLIVYAITGLIVLFSIPVLGKEKVMEIFGDTSIEVIMMVIMMYAMIGIPLGIYAFVKEQQSKGDESDE